MCARGNRWHSADSDLLVHLGRGGTSNKKTLECMPSCTLVFKLINKHQINFILDKRQTHTLTKFKKAKEKKDPCS